MRNGSADGGPGRHLTTVNGKSFWAGVWFRWWGEYESTPAWAQVKVPGTQQLAQLAEALTAESIRHFVRPENADVLMPLHVPCGEELGTVEATLIVQLQKIAAVLDSTAVQVVEDPVAEVPVDEVPNQAP